MATVVSMCARVQSSELIRAYKTANRLSEPYEPCLASNGKHVPHVPELRAVGGVALRG